MLAAGFLLFQRVRFGGRARLGMPANLVGNGMLFGRSVLEAHPWNAFTGVEDLEYSMRLRLAGMAERANSSGRVIANDCQNAAPQLPGFRVERFGEASGAGNFAGNYGIPDRLGRRRGSRQKRGEVERLGETSRAPH